MQATAKAKTTTRYYRAMETERMRELDGSELASFQARGTALLLDFAIAAALFLVAGAMAAIGARKMLKLEHIDFELTFFENWYSIVYLVAFFGLSLYIGNGKTIGKKLMGIRVVSLVHHRMSLWHSIERALGYGASTLEFGFGFVQYYIHPNRRTVHDRMAETIVVRDR